MPRYLRRRASSVVLVVNTVLDLITLALWWPTAGETPICGVAAFAITSWAVNFVDDLVDDPAASGRQIPGLRPALTVLAAAGAVYSGNQSELLAMICVGTGIGCFLTGKIDCWEHGIVLFSTTIPMLIKWTEWSTLAPATLRFVGYALCITVAAAADEFANEVGGTMAASTSQLHLTLGAFLENRPFTDLMSIILAVISGERAPLIAIVLADYEGSHFTAVMRHFVPKRVVRGANQLKEVMLRRTTGVKAMKVP